MNNEINQKQDMPVPAEWSGYTLEELRYQRALSLIKLENQKLILKQRFRPEKKEVMQSGIKGLGVNLLQRISEKMTIVDYLLIGYNLSKMFLKFKRKRR